MNQATLLIDGMSCSHCVASIRKILESFPVEIIAIQIGKICFRIADIQNSNQILNSIITEIQELGYSIIEASIDEVE